MDHVRLWLAVLPLPSAFALPTPAAALAWVAVTLLVKHLVIQGLGAWVRWSVSSAVLLGHV